MELCTNDRLGLLSDVTRIFREYGLSVTRAEVATKGGKAINTFYVRDAAGNPVDAKTIESVRQALGLSVILVKGDPGYSKSPPQESSTSTRFLLSSLFKAKSLYGFGLVRP